jgi:hypothetical protein
MKQLTNSKYTFTYNHPTEQGWVAVFVRNTHQEFKRTGDKYMIDWYNTADNNNNPPFGRQVMSKRVLEKDFQMICDYVARLRSHLFRKSDSLWVITSEFLKDMEEFERVGEW